MKITIERVDGVTDHKCVYDAFTVHVESHRILTVATSCDNAITKWVKEVKKTTNTKGKELVIGVATGRRDCYDIYGLLQLCVGSHCLVYVIPAPYKDEPTNRALLDLLAASKVIAVGMNMRSVAKKLEAEAGIKFGRVADLMEMGEESMGVEIMRFCGDLDELVKVVLGREVRLVRPDEKEIEWFTERSSWWWYEELTDEKVKYATVDAYLSYMTGYQLLNKKAKLPAFIPKEKKHRKKLDKRTGKWK